MKLLSTCPKSAWAAWFVHQEQYPRLPYSLPTFVIFTLNFILFFLKQNYCIYVSLKKKKKVLPCCTKQESNGISPSNISPELKDEKNWDFLWKFWKNSRLNLGYRKNRPAMICGAVPSVPFFIFTRWHYTLGLIKLKR